MKAEASVKIQGIQRFTRIGPATSAMGGEGVGRKQTNKSFERTFVSSTETKATKRFSGFGLV